jgi:hypothetical protein
MNTPKEHFTCGVLYGSCVLQTQRHSSKGFGFVTAQTALMSQPKAIDPKRAQQNGFGFRDSLSGLASGSAFPRVCFPLPGLCGNFKYLKRRGRDPFEKRCNDLFCMNLEPTKTSKSLFRLESAQQKNGYRFGLRWDHGE